VVPHLPTRQPLLDESSYLLGLLQFLGLYTSISRRVLIIEYNYINLLAEIPEADDIRARGVIQASFQQRKLSGQRSNRTRSVVGKTIIRTRASAYQVLHTCGPLT